MTTYVPDRSLPPIVQVRDVLESLLGAVAVVVQRGATDVVSAANLRTASAAAKLLTPGGNALAAGNRVAVIIPSGRYDFGTGDGGNNGLILDTEFVDYIGETGLPEDVVLTSQIVTASRGTVQKTVDDIHIKGVTLDMGAASSGVAFLPTGSHANEKLTDVIIRSVYADSMRDSIDYAGTYTNVDCEGEGNCFGQNGYASGTFINCIATGVSGFGSRSFSGGSNGYASGTFIDCVGGNYSFGGWGTASGTFINCEGGDGSFGQRPSGSAAVMRRCRSYDRSVEIEDWQGLMIDCDIEVTTPGMNAVELARCYVGVAKTSTDDAGNTTTNFRIMGEDCAAEFPINSFIYHTAESTWHRITASVYDATNTNVTVSPAVGGGDDWKEQTVRAQAAPRIINCRLISTDNAISADANTPCLIDGVISNKAEDATNYTNMIASPSNHFGEEHAAACYFPGL